MKFYFAPMEGITTYTYRNAHAAQFGGCDGYFAPFITPSDNEKVSRKGLRDVVPEKNPGVPLSVQVLTNQVDSFLKFAYKVRALGYDEININLGCPSATVVRKGRGAGFLCEPESLDRFLEGIFEKSDMKISVKTRIGYTSPEEFDRLLTIYNRYPLSLLIVHPRTREEFYGGDPHYDVFTLAYQASKNPLCYNGDIFSKEDFRRIRAEFPDLDSVMLGRGALRNPALFREIQGGETLKTEELVTFTQALTENYYALLRSEAHTLQKIKEVWTNLGQNYPAEKKLTKVLKKANSLQDFMATVKCFPML